MNVTAIIPARFGSTRFPGKPLARETDKYLIQHVVEQATKARRVGQVVVATDDPRILEAVTRFGGRAVLTRADHPSGTDRVAEAAAALGLGDDDLVLNVQGDEPEMDPGHLDRLVEAMVRSPACRMGTLACPFAADGPREGVGSPADPNRVKVVIDATGQAVYFSRSLIPYPRDTGGKVVDPSRWLLHVGVYAYRLDWLRAYPTLGHGGRAGAGGPTGADGTLSHATIGGLSNLEDVERLEQLRALEWRSRGGGIAVAVVDRAAPGVDTPEDYAAFVARWRRHG